MPNLLFWNLQKVNTRSSFNKLAHMQANCRTYFGAPPGGVPYPDVCAFSEVSIRDWETVIPELGSAIYQAPSPPNAAGSFHDFSYNALDPNVQSMYSTERATEYFAYARLKAGAVNSTPVKDAGAIPALRWEPVYSVPGSGAPETIHGIRKLGVYTFQADGHAHTATDVYVHHPSPTNADHSFRTLLLAMRQANFHTRRVLVAGDFNIRPTDTIGKGAPEYGVGDGLTAAQFAQALGFEPVVPAAAPPAGCSCGRPGQAHTHAEGLIDWAVRSPAVGISGIRILPKIDPDSDHHPVYVSFT